MSVHGSTRSVCKATLGRCAKPPRTEPKGPHATRMARPRHLQLVQHTASPEASPRPEESGSSHRPGGETCASLDANGREVPRGGTCRTEIMQPCPLVDVHCLPNLPRQVAQSGEDLTRVACSTKIKFQIIRNDYRNN